MTNKIATADLLKIASKHTKEVLHPTRYVTDTVAAMKEVIALCTPPASAQDDAKDGLTLAQKYDDACTFANANARDAQRYRTVRQSVADEANGADQISAAGEAIGLRPGAYPTPEQFDAMIDHIAASQQQEG